MSTTADTTIQRARRADLIPGYELVQLVGKGGMGEVHQAVQLSLKRTVAVKLLNPELAKDEQFVARFEKEAAALAALRHPNIVSIVDRGRAAETYYLVMEFIDGPTLRELMRDPEFDVTQSLRVLVQIARAIDYAHGRGIIHRDLKPENILFDEQAGNLPKVSDFGLAGFDEKANQPRQNLTATHMAMGTATYMAPEQQLDARTAGPKADIYSLGVLMYELLVGVVPMGNFDSPSMTKPGIDKRLDAIVARCLKPSPDDRYPTMAELVADLERLVAVTSPPAPSKETPWERLRRRGKEVGFKVSKVVGAVLVLGAAVIVTTVFVRASAEAKKVPSGVELTTDFGQHAPLAAPGRLERAARTLTLGAGPDTVTVMTHGRKAVIEGGAIVYAPTELPTGRAVIDAEVQGEGLRVSALVDTEPLKPSSLEPLWALFRGPRPDARSALLLLGDNGRYVALVVSGGASEPTLEWSLGPAKRGAMRAPLPVKAAGESLSLRIDPVTGDLAPVIGLERDARVLGDGLRLGPGWRALFGTSLRAGVGCLEGRCAFREVNVEGLVAPVVAPPLPPPPVESVEREPVSKLPVRQPPPPVKPLPPKKAPLPPKKK